jgi:hypothetical protein
MWATTGMPEWQATLKRYDEMDEDYYFWDVF